MKLTASGLHRAMACPSSSNLPHVGFVSNDADAGTARHEYLRLVSELGAEQALQRIDEKHRKMCEVIDLSEMELDPDRVACEVAFAWDWESDAGRELGRNLGRRYEVEGQEIPGTADVVSLLGEDGVLVDDYKGVDPSTPRAAVNWQMRFLALAACRAYGRSRAVVRLRHIREDGTSWLDRATFDAFDLADFAEVLWGLGKRIQEGAEKLVEGPHCRRCPAFSNCPAKKELALSLSDAEDDGLAFTPDNAVQVLKRVEAAEMVLKHVRERLEQYARERPFVVGEGEVFGPDDNPKPSIDDEKAMMVVAEKYGADVAEASVKRAPKFQTGLMEKALSEYRKRHNLGIKQKELHAEARNLLRARGAEKTVITHPVRRHKLGSAEADAVLLPPPALPEPDVQPAAQEGAA